MLTKCRACGIPEAECTPMGVWESGIGGKWRCRSCEEEATIRCSYCNEALATDEPLPEPLDDMSFLCPKCNTQLLEELDDFTDNYESYTTGPTGPPWYQHRLPATPRQ